MNNKKQKEVDPKDPFGINNMAFDLKAMIEFGNNLSKHTKDSLDKIKNSEQFTPEQKAEIEKKINESGVHTHLKDLKEKLADLKNFGTKK